MRLSLALAVLGTWHIGSASLGMAAPIAIAIEPEISEVTPGGTVDVLFVARGGDTPIFGYSLDVDVLPTQDAVGTVTVDVASTNFFDVRNLITAGGAVRDPQFSWIIDPGDGGVFISTNTEDGSTLLPVEGVNNVLAQVVFDVSADAFGDFTIDLGPATALANADFDFAPGTITVVPEPGMLTLGVLGIGLLALRRRS